MLESQDVGYSVTGGKVSRCYAMQLVVGEFEGEGNSFDMSTTVALISTPLISRRRRVRATSEVREGFSGGIRHWRLMAA